uniref:Malonyl-CoA:ACP transacylase (MAT) domain-containing protein n=1 Tax=Alexandrium catenella TaxID=2925 RepID=A0A7S1RUQ6_ALECA
METKANDAGALQAKILKTSGAFHTRMMQGAKDHLLTQLNAHKASMKSPRCLIYMNTTAETIGPQTTPDEIIAMLGKQLVSPVLWRQSMEAAIRDGCKEFYELGPSKQLRAMMKRIDPATMEKMTNVIA